MAPPAAFAPTASAADLPEEFRTVVGPMVNSDMLPIFVGKKIRERTRKPDRPRARLS